MVCKLCGRNEPLVRAHIIPRSFYKQLMQLDPSAPLEVLSNRSDTYARKSWTGIYDTGILCGICERTFSPWDDYAQKVLLAEPPEDKYISVGGRRAGYEIEGVDYERLKLFFVSVLWRSSVSTEMFFSRINVGPFQSALNTMIRQGDPGAPDTFAVSLARFDHELGLVKFDPYRNRFAGVNYYVFYMAGYVVYIKVDSRPVPTPLDSFVLSPHSPLRVITRDFSKSKELEIAYKIIRKAESRK